MATDHVVLALDVGSSSVRCTAYKIVKETNESCNNDELISTTKVSPIHGCLSSSRALRCVQPNTGKINLEQSMSPTATQEVQEKASGEGNHTLLDEIDLCVDDQLQRLEQYFSSAKIRFQVVGLGISSFVMNLVAVDREGNIIGADATCSYACNTPEVADECKRLRARLGSDRVHALHERTGAPLHSAFALAQLRSLYKNESLMDRSTQTNAIHKWQTIASLCLARWMGRSCLPISYSEASWTGLLNFRTCTWDDDALSLLPAQVRAALPEVCDFSDPVVLAGGIPQFNDGSSDSSVVKLKNPYWDRWPALRGVNSITACMDGGDYCRLFMGLGDGACANIGSQCCTSNRIAVTIGTSAAARVVIPFKRLETATVTESITPPRMTMKVPQGLFCYRVDQNHVLLGGALTDGGSIVEWCRSLLNLGSAESFEECIYKAEELLERDYSTSSENRHCHTHTLVMAPFLSGERSTGWRDGATGALLNITRETTAAHLLKSSLESVVLRINAIIQLICEVTATHGSNLEQRGNEMPDCSSSPSVRIVASGNALDKSKLWRQMLADCTRLQVCHLTEIPEATSYGAARMVAITAMSAKDSQNRSKEASASASNDVSDSRTLRLDDEELSKSATVSAPREYTDLYWSNAAAAQEKFIDALTPIW